MTGPRSALCARPSAIRVVAASITAVSSRLPASARSATRRCSRTRSPDSSFDSAMTPSCWSSSSRSSPCARTSARTVAGCSTTGAKHPGSSASSRRQSAVSNADVTGGSVSPAAASSCSARRRSVVTLTAATPRWPPTPTASARRTLIAAMLSRTMIVTGASGEPAFASATRSLSFATASSPCAVVCVGMRPPSGDATGLSNGPAVRPARSATRRPTHCRSRAASRPVLFAGRSGCRAEPETPARAER